MKRIDIRSEGKGVQRIVTGYHQAKEAAKSVEEIGRRWMNGPTCTMEMTTDPLDLPGRCENDPLIA